MQIQAWVEGRGLFPATVADRYDLDFADVYAALAYYYQHPHEMQSIKNQRAQAFEELRDEIERPAGIDPASVEISFPAEDNPSPTRTTSNDGAGMGISHR